VDAFLKERTDVTVMLDLSRQGAIGRKLYLQIGPVRSSEPVQDSNV
jgi:hypothetical protein